MSKRPAQSRQSTAQQAPQSTGLPMPSQSGYPRAPSKPHASAPMLVRAAWDFDRGGCPEDELEHCCFYEYALELPEVRRLAIWWRGNRNRVRQTGDKADNLLRDKWYGLPFRVLADHPEFPDKHWLQIDPLARKQKIAHSPPWSTIHIPNKPPMYVGPEPANFTRLQAERLIWQAIERETEGLRNQFDQACGKNSLRRWPCQLRDFLSTEEVADWKQRLSKLSGDALYATACKLLASCKRTIQRHHRSPFELVVYEIDWTLRPDELVERFRQWTKTNRVHQPRKRSGGHSTKAVELLRGLGAKRLMDFFRNYQKTLPQPYKVQTLYAALCDYTRDERETAGRPAKPLYSNPSGWNDAENSADDHLKAL